MKIKFITGNDRKLSEASLACEPFGIKVEKIKLEIDEIQSHDPTQISKRKAKDAYSLINMPLVINDATWRIPALGGFPGGYMKDIAEWFRPEDFISLMSKKHDRSICLVETVIFRDESTEKIFQKEYWGEISKTPKGTGNSIEMVAMFDGETIGECFDAGRFAFNPEDYIWNDFAEWFVQTGNIKP